MQKLIIILNHSDGYTYSSEETKPVIYSSKEEFIIELEDLTTKYLKDIKEYHSKQEKFDNTHEKIREEYSKITDKKQRSKPNANIDKQEQEASKKFLQSFHDRTKFILENKPLDTFVLGGQDFSYENFYYMDERTKNFIVCIPTVQTIDEYFEEVELKLNKPVSKHKLK